jgi:hypothetical protein
MAYESSELSLLLQNLGVREGTCTLKKDTVYLSKMLVTTFQTTQCYNAKDLRQHVHCPTEVYVRHEFSLCTF